MSQSSSVTTTEKKFIVFRSALDLFPSLSSVATGDLRLKDIFVCGITENDGTKQTRCLYSHFLPWKMHPFWVYEREREIGSIIFSRIPLTKPFFRSSQVAVLRRDSMTQVRVIMYGFTCKTQFLTIFFVALHHATKTFSLSTKMKTFLKERIISDGRQLLLRPCWSQQRSNCEICRVGLFNHFYGLKRSYAYLVKYDWSQKADVISNIKKKL